MLSIVAEGPTYGYLIAQRLEREGLGQIKGGTLYPLLARYEQEGLVEASWQPGGTGPGRKYFTLTDAGREHLTEVRRRWAEFVRVAGALIEAGVNR